MKIATKLDSVKIKNINKITRIPGIEEIITKGKPKLYGIRYFLFTSKFKKIPLVIRITSLKNSFNTINSVDIFDKSGNPTAGLEIKPDLDENKFLKLISELTKSIKYTNESKEISLDNYLSHLNEKINLPPEAIMPIFTGIIVAASTIHYYVTKYLNRKKEKESSGPAEQSINDKLFSGQKYDEPEFKMYANLQNFIKFVVLGKAPAVILCGPPGMSKTYIVRRTFHFEKLVPGKDYMIEKGSTLTLGAVYDLLYKHRNRILVLDDFDTPLKNEDTVNMLKAITDSYEKRILSLPREKMMSRDDSGQVSSTPSKFEYKGKLIIITNLKKRDIDRALLSRAPAFEVNFDSKQILKSLEGFMKFVSPEVNMKIKQEVLDYILYLYAKNKHLDINFRAFKCSVDARVGNPLYWKEMIQTIVGYDL